MADVLLLIVVALTLAATCSDLWLSQRLSQRMRSTEHAMVAALRVLETRTGPLPRELTDFITANPGGAHRG